jgi:hypothetical protein
LNNDLFTKWIWASDWTYADSEKPKIVLFRKVVKIKKDGQNCLVNISADSRYRLFVNGVSVCAGPCKGDANVWYYETVDLSEYLVDGENVITASVLRYPTDGGYNVSVWRTPLPFFYIDGPEPFTTDGTWKSYINNNIEVFGNPRQANFLYCYEKAKGDISLAGWMSAGYDDSHWASVKPYSIFQISRTVSPGDLSPRPIPLMFETERRFVSVKRIRQSVCGEGSWNELLCNDVPLIIPANVKEIVEIDAGELTTGYLQSTLINGTGAKITTLCSEAYVYAVNDTPQSTKGDRTDSENGILEGYEDFYTAAGYGRNGLPEKYETFWFRTFRFIRLEIETADEELTITRFGYRETGYPLDVKTHVTTSAPEFLQIWNISVRTLRRCMHETYEDCPFYEQLQYTMDTRSQILFTYNISADDRMARRTIDDFSRGQLPCGLLPDRHPSYDVNVIIGFNFYYVLMLHDHMMYFGDKALIKKYMATVDKMLAFFDRNLDERGLVSQVGGLLMRHKYWSYIDWVEGWDTGVPNAIKYGPLTMESLLYVYGLTYAAELAEYVGRSGVAEEYRTRAEAVKAAVLKHCIGKNGLLQDGPGVDEYSQHCQVFAVLTELLPTMESVKLMEAVLADETLAKCSVSFAFYMFRALEKAGMYERTKAQWEPWRKMLEYNLTTCCETIDNPRSDCHAWGSIILYELPAVILGVRPAKPGYAAITVNPNPSWLESVSGDVYTPKGIVSVSWKRDGERIKLKVTVPEGVEVLR